MAQSSHKNQCQTPHQQEMRKLSELRPYPRRDLLCPDLSAAELSELAASLQKYGMQNSLEILPNGLILHGVQRFRAARELGWEEVPVRVRSDLAVATPQTIQQHLLMQTMLSRFMAMEDLLDVVRTQLIPPVVEDFRYATNELESLSADEQIDIPFNAEDSKMDEGRSSAGWSLVEIREFQIDFMEEYGVTETQLYEMLRILRAPQYILRTFRPPVGA